MSDLIDRQAAIEMLEKGISEYGDEYGISDAICDLDDMPSAQPEIIRCKDCRWWDKFDEYDKGYCMAAKHGYWSGHWEISIRRKYEGDFYCADAERRTNE